jgi:hypothetical protein
MEHYQERNSLSTLSGTVPTLLANDEILIDLTNAANTFNNFFITIIEKLNIKQTQRR